MPAVQVVAEHQHFALPVFLPANPRRRWCSPAICGNRARVARYYQRHKDVTPRSTAYMRSPACAAAKGPLDPGPEHQCQHEVRRELQKTQRPT